MTVTPEQREQLRDRRAGHAEYKRFNHWLQRRLECIDSGVDLPARRITNGTHRAILAARTSRQRRQAAVAERLSRVVMNRIIAASVHDPCPDGYVGDLVVDETTFDVAAAGYRMGGSDRTRRSAAYLATFYRRKRGVLDDPAAAAGDDAGGNLTLDKMAFGIGVTAITRVGKPGSIRAVVPVTTAIDVHQPTSGSGDAVDHALAHHRIGGFDPRSATRRGKNARNPMLTADMGYTIKDRYAELLLRRGYDMLARYPKHWHPVSRAVPPPDGDSRTSLDEPDPGPVLAYGAFYCPAAEEQLTAPLVVGSRQLKDTEAWRAQDDRLAWLLPKLMGVNSRIRQAAPRRARPKHGTPRRTAYKIDLVCPAVQGRCRCPLKPESMRADPDTTVTLSPTWQPADKTCCQDAHVTVTLTPQQLKQYQGAMPAGSWEHQILYEAYRSLTERRFSLDKSPYLTRLNAINWGPRREPMLKLLIALNVAVANLEAQDAMHRHEADTHQQARRPRTSTRARPRAHPAPHLTHFTPSVGRTERLSGPREHALTAVTVSEISGLRTQPGSPHDTRQSHAITPAADPEVPTPRTGRSTSPQARTMPPPTAGRTIQKFSGLRDQTTGNTPTNRDADQQSGTAHSTREPSRTFGPLPVQPQSRL